MGLGLSSLLEARFVLAPMAGITDMPHRLFMRELGAELVISELISSEGFAHGSKKTKEMVLIHPDEHPAGIQIFGADDEKMAALAAFSEERGADFVDINLGCPVPKVVKCGAGSAMLRDPQRLARLLKRVKQEISVPLSIKIRTGWDSSSINASEIIKVAEDHDIAWVGVHGRTRAQGYMGEANWDLIEKLNETSGLPLLGNGDIHSPELANKRLEQCHGVMIGRGALADPLIFWKSRLLRGTETRPIPKMEEVVRLLFEKVMKYNHPLVAHTKLKKLFVWFATGIPGKGPFRKKIFSMKNEPENILECGLEFLNDEQVSKRQGDDLGFLKGGHG